MNARMFIYTDTYTDESVAAGSPVEAMHMLLGEDTILSHIHPATDDGEPKWCAHVLLVDTNTVSGQLVWDRDMTN